MTDAFLPDRALLRVSGADAESFLHNLVTTDLAGLPAGEARPGALLTPQGKILFDFLIWREGDGFLIETDAEQLDALTKRLTLYRLRAAVTLAPAGQGVTVSWAPPAEGAADARFAKAGITLTRRAGRHGDGDPSAYHGLRIRAGLVEAGRDYPLQDAFPHDVLLDLTQGLSFRKGCYVGQEVVSRMQHRGTARRRVVLVEADTALPATGADLTAGGKPLGTLGSVDNAHGLAIVRIDRAGDAMTNGLPILAGDVPVRLTLAGWTGLTFPSGGDEAQA